MADTLIKTFDGKTTHGLFNTEAIQKATADKETLRGYAETICLIINAAVLDGNFSPFIEVAENVSVNARELLTDTVNAYTAIARGECFEAIKATDDPMLTAVTQLTFPTIKAVEKKVGEDKEKVPVMSITDIEKPIDLLRLNRYIKEGIGKEKNWAHIAQKFNFLLTVQKAKDLGIDPNDVTNYDMSDVAKDIDMGKTPTSNTNLLRTLQKVITAMIGEDYKAVSHDVKFLQSVYSKKNNRKALTVAVSNHKNFVMYIAEICHRIVTGKTYSLEYKTIKK